MKNVIHMVLALVVLGAYTLTYDVVPQASAQSVLLEGKGDDGKGKGKPDPVPPEVPSTGPGSVVALAAMAAAGYVMYRRTSQTYVAQQA